VVLFRGISGGFFVLAFMFLLFFFVFVWKIMSSLITPKQASHRGVSVKIIGCRCTQAAQEALVFCCGVFLQAGCGGGGGVFLGVLLLSCESLTVTCVGE